MKKSAPSRIVVVSSVMHWFGRINVETMTGKETYNHMSDYSNSKLANVLFTRELSKGLRDTGESYLSIIQGRLIMSYFHAWNK